MTPAAGRRPPAAYRLADRLAVAAALVLFAALALYGARVHWVEEAGTAERDGYVDQALQLRHGELPRDPFRPLLYPLLAAALAPAAGGAFAAARLISNAAAAALAWLAYAFGRRLARSAAGGGGRQGAWAMALVALNPNLWILGQHVSTDMLFGALGAGVLLAGLAYLEEGRTRHAGFAGLALGLAAFIRSNALFLLPPLAAALWPAPRGGRRLGARGLRGPALAAALCLAALVPHWALRHAAFGNPFHDENWKNLAWKLHGYPDWSYLERVPYSGLAAVIAASPRALLEGGFAELARFAASGAAQLLGTWAHVLLLVAGTAWCLLRRRPRAPVVWLLAACLFFLLATAFSFFTWGRLLLLLLPPCAALSAFLTCAGPPAPAASPEAAPAPRDGAPPTAGMAPLAASPAAASAFRSGGGTTESAGGGDALPVALQRFSRAAAVILGLAAGALAMKTFGFRLPAFIAHHPYGEIAALRRLEPSLSPGAAVAGTSPFLGRYLHHPYVALPDAFGAEVGEERLYFKKLAGLLAEARVSYLVIGEIDLRDRPRSLLAPGGAAARSPVSWLDLMWSGGSTGRKVVVWRVGAVTRPASNLAGR